MKKIEKISFIYHILALRLWFCYTYAAGRSGGVFVVGFWAL